MDSLFGLYQRFHEGIKGKGLGHYMIKTQIETLGGEIHVRSEVGKGTIFSNTFKTDDALLINQMDTHRFHSVYVKNL